MREILCASYKYREYTILIPEQAIEVPGEENTFISLIDDKRKNKD